MRPVRVVAIVVVSAVLAACSGSKHLAWTGPRGIALAQYRSDVMTFTYPKAWRAQHSEFGNNFVDLATAPLGKLVIPSQHNPKAGACIDPCSPFDHLGPNGVWAYWAGGDGGVPQDPNFRETLVGLPTVDGLPSRIITEHPGFCGSLNAGETVTARIYRAGYNQLMFQACLQGPDLATLEREAMSVVRSAKVLQR